MSVGQTMAAFLEDITPFLGENRVNEDGLSLVDFLEKYNPKEYENPSVTADIMVFWSEQKLTDVTKDLRVLLIRRRNHPSIGWWALPGGFVEISENADDAAARELKEETGLMNIPMEQLCAWGDYNRDPRTRIVTISYIALVEEKPNAKAGDDAEDTGWFDVCLNKISEEITEHRKRVLYELTLTDTENGHKVAAMVAYSYRLGTILKDERFEVLSRDHLAFDHPAFLVRGLLHLQKRLQEQ